jgi:hypothetical protein
MIISQKNISQQRPSYLRNSQMFHNTENAKTKCGQCIKFGKKYDNLPRHRKDLVPNNENKSRSI